MNMTTFDIDFGASINQIYKQKIDQRSASQVLVRNKSNVSISNKIVPNSSETFRYDCNNPKPNDGEANKNNRKTLERSGTVPSLRQTQVSESQGILNKGCAEIDRNHNKLIPDLPPKAPMKSNEQLNYTINSIPMRNCDAAITNSARYENKQNVRQNQNHYQSVNGKEFYVSNGNSALINNKLKLNGERTSLQQSRSVANIKSNRVQRDYSSNSDICSPPKIEEKVGEIQSGNDWTCMWLNHFKREEDALTSRQNKYEKNIHMILSNPAKFGTDYNNINEMNKDKMRTTFIENN